MFKRTFRDRDNKATENPTPEHFFARGRENVSLEMPSSEVSIQRQEESTALTSVTPRRKWSAIQLLTSDGNSRSGVFAQRKQEDIIIQRKKIKGRTGIRELFDKVNNATENLKGEYQQTYKKCVNTLLELSRRVDNYNTVYDSDPNVPAEAKVEALQQIIDLSNSAWHQHKNIAIQYMGGGSIFKEMFNNIKRNYVWGTADREKIEKVKFSAQKELKRVTEKELGMEYESYAGSHMDTTGTGGGVTAAVKQEMQEDTD